MRTIEHNTINIDTRIGIRVRVAVSIPTAVLPISAVDVILGVDKR